MNLKATLTLVLACPDAVLLLLLLMVAGCGGGGGTPPAPPGGDLTGQWLFVLTPKDECGNPVGSETQDTVEIQQTEGTARFRYDGENIEAIVSGDELQINHRYADGEIMQANLRIVDEFQRFDGLVTWNDGECVSNDEIVATRLPDFEPLSGVWRIRERWRSGVDDLEGEEIEYVVKFIPGENGDFDVTTPVGTFTGREGRWETKFVDDGGNRRDTYQVELPDSETLLEGENAWKNGNESGIHSVVAELLFPLEDAPAVQTSGGWLVLERVEDGDCGPTASLPLTEIERYELNQQGAEVFVQRCPRSVGEETGCANPRTFRGSVHGDQIFYFGTVPEDGGVTKFTALAKVTGNTLEGEIYFHWSNADASCSGSQEIFGLREDAYPDAGGFPRQWSLSSNCQALDIEEPPCDFGLPASTPATVLQQQGAMIVLGLPGGHLAGYLDDRNRLHLEGEYAGPSGGSYAELEGSLEYSPSLESLEGDLIWSLFSVEDVLLCKGSCELRGDTSSDN